MHPQPREPPHQGLTTSEAAERLRLHGPNEIKREAGRSPWALLLQQLNSPRMVATRRGKKVGDLLGRRDGDQAADAA